MKLVNLLAPEQVILDLAGEVCEEATRFIVDHLVAHRLLPEESYEEVLELLYERERQVSTGIGSGVAIPHTFTDAIDRVICVFARSKNGVEFEAVDNAPVNFIILLLAPLTERHTHLQTLAEVARTFNQCGVRKALMAANTEEGILEILAGDPAEAG